MRPGASWMEEWASKLNLMNPILEMASDIFSNDSSDNDSTTIPELFEKLTCFFNEIKRSMFFTGNVILRNIFYLVLKNERFAPNLEFQKL